MLEKCIQIRSLFISMIVIAPRWAPNLCRKIKFENVNSEILYKNKFAELIPGIKVFI